MKLAGCSSPSRSIESISTPFEVSRKNEHEKRFSAPLPLPFLLSPSRGEG
jgi:hypothetical protein